jgi:hypothetical protein
MQDAERYTAITSEHILLIGILITPTFVLQSVLSAHFEEMGTKLMPIR